METISLLSDGSTMSLLGRVVALTLFYTALFWLPLRGTAGLLRRIRQALRGKAARGSAARS